MVYAEELVLAFPETDEMLDDWRRDVEMAITALEQKPRVANPGARCGGCPYLGVCEEARSYLEDVSPHASPEEMATAYAVTVAEVGRLRDSLKPACGEGAIDVGDFVVGFVREEQQRITDDGYAKLAEEWGDFGDQAGKVRGLLRAIAPSKTSAESVLKTLYPERQDIDHRREVLDSITEPYGVRRFKVQRKKKEEIEE